MKVFITHGHDEVAKFKVKDFLATHLMHQPVILGEQPGRQGLTIIEALEKFCEGCEFAVILLSGDDMTKDGGVRARQNVIHEVGFFQGFLGRSKVVLVVEEGVEIPSNLSGLFYLQYRNDIKEVFIDLEMILKAGDASVSAKKLDANSLGIVEQLGTADRSWVQQISAELEPYVDLPPKTFFLVVRPILKKHGDGFAEQAEQLKSQPMAGKEINKNNLIGEIIKRAIGAGIVMLGAPSERVANLCHSAVTIIDNTSEEPADQHRAKTVILRMFGLTL